MNTQSNQKKMPIKAKETPKTSKEDNKTRSRTPILTKEVISKPINPSAPLKTQTSNSNNLNSLTQNNLLKIKRNRLLEESPIQLEIVPKQTLGNILQLQNEQNVEELDLVNSLEKLTKNLKEKISDKKNLDISKNLIIEKVESKLNDQLDKFTKIQSKVNSSITETESKLILMQNSVENLKQEESQFHSKESIIHDILIKFCCSLAKVICKLDDTISQKLETKCTSCGAINIENAKNDTRRTNKKLNTSLNNSAISRPNESNFNNMSNFAFRCFLCREIGHKMNECLNKKK